MKGYNDIEVNVTNGIATIWLNRPDVQNAVGNTMLDELIDCVSHIDQLDNVRIIVLRGRGKSFSAGADLKMMQAASTAGFEKNLEDGFRWANCVATLKNSTKPLIGIATGNVFGGGNGLLGACDLVIADSDAVFSFSEVKLGLAPSTILPYILARIGEQKSKYLMFTGKRFTAADAYEYGLVDFLVNSSEIVETLNKLTSDILKASPGGIKEIKMLIRTLKSTNCYDNIKDLTANSIARLKISDEAQEGLAAFIEKRKPSWVSE